MEYISLICPILNEEKNITRFLDLILAQGYIPEIVFVDGGSTDKTIEIIKSYQKKCKKIKLIELNQRGTGKAINIGFLYSSGKYIMHVGADFRFIGKNIFLKAKEFIKSQKNLDLLILKIPPKLTGNILKDAFLFWDNRFLHFFLLLFIKREIFPTYPEISYGEDKIAAKQLSNSIKYIKNLFIDESFLRFQEDFSLNSFIKRYLWYGRTFLPYLRLCNDPKEYLRISISVLSIFFPPFLLIPFLIGIYDSLKFLKIFPFTLIFFPIFAVGAAWTMGIGFLIGFFKKDLGH